MVSVDVQPAWPVYMVRLWPVCTWAVPAELPPRSRPCETGVFFFSSRRRHTRCSRDWSSDVCSSDLGYIITHNLGETGPFRVRTGRRKAFENGAADSLSYRRRRTESATTPPESCQKRRPQGDQPAFRVVSGPGLYGRRPESNRTTAPLARRPSEAWEGCSTEARHPKTVPPSPAAHRHKDTLVSAHLKKKVRPKGTPTLTSSASAQA